MPFCPLLLLIDVALSLPKMYALKVEQFICLDMIGTQSTLCSFLSVLVICRIIFIDQVKYIAKSLLKT